MLSKTQISTASSTLDEIDVSMLVAVIRASKRFKENPAYYNDLEAKIEDTDGSVKAQQLNAVLAEIVKIGIGEIAIEGGDEGLRYSRTREREALVNYAISVIYGQPFSSTDGTTTSGSVRVGQRDLDSYEGYL